LSFGLSLRSTERYASPIIAFAEAGLLLAAARLLLPPLLLLGWSGLLKS
jgi:hypothetical protein